jgi:CBS domain-containing protein
MTTLLVILWLILAVCLVIIVAIRPARTKHSWYELQRRGDHEAMRREQILGSLRGVLQFIMLCLVGLMAVVAYLLWEGWGLLDMLVAILIVFALAKWKLVSKPVMHQYKHRESKLLGAAERVSFFGRLFGESGHVNHDQHLESPEQLLHLVGSAGHVLTGEQQELIRRGLDWHTTLVGDVMTPRESIETIKASELLGPLVLNDLHQTGHTVFPVTKQGIDHIIGVLDIAEHLRVDKVRSSQTAEQVMIPETFSVLEDAPLPVALQLLLSTRHPFLVVTDDDGKTVGLVTQRDVLGALLGDNI